MCYCCLNRESEREQHSKVVLRSIADDLPGAGPKQAPPGDRSPVLCCAAIRRHVEVSRGRATLRFLPGYRRERRHPTGKGVLFSARGLGPNPNPTVTLLCSRAGGGGGIQSATKSGKIRQKRGRSLGVLNKEQRGFLALDGSCY